MPGSLEVQRASSCSSMTSGRMHSLSEKHILLRSHISQFSIGAWVSCCHDSSHFVNSCNTQGHLPKEALASFWLRTMHGGGSAPSCCAFTHRVAFEEGSGPRVATEEGLTSRGGRNLRLPLSFGLRPQGPCRVATREKPRGSHRLAR